MQNIRLFLDLKLRGFLSSISTKVFSQNINWSLFLAWLVTNPKLYFPLDQDQLPESCMEHLEGIFLWEADVSTLGEGLTSPYDGVIKVEQNVGYICLLSFLLLLLSLFFIISLETMHSTQSNCPISVSVNIVHNLVELCQ